jgi:hypothetical protein
LTGTDGVWKSKGGKIRIDKVSGDGKSIRSSFKVLLENRMGPGSVTAAGMTGGKISNRRSRAAPDRST